MPTDAHRVLGVGNKLCPNASIGLTGKGDADASFAKDVTDIAVVIDPQERVNLRNTGEVVSCASF